MTDTSAPASGQVWRHWKGNAYRILGTALDAETAERIVLYRDAENDLAPIWARPIAEWHHQVTASKRRFELLSRMPIRRPTMKDAEAEAEASERRWTIAFSVAAVMFMLTPNIASYRAGYKSGLEAGREQGELAAKDNQDRVNAQLRSLGLCEWPASLYKATKCGEIHDEGR